MVIYLLNSASAIYLLNPGLNHKDPPSLFSDIPRFIALILFTYVLFTNSFEITLVTKDATAKINFTLGWFFLPDNDTKNQK